MLPFYKQHGITDGVNAFGQGIISSKILAHLGLEDNNKTLFPAVVTATIWGDLKADLKRDTDIDEPGTGLAGIRAMEEALEG